jgi:hypothetical protein
VFICRVPRNADEFSRVLCVEQGLFGELSIPPNRAYEFFEAFPEIYTAVFDSKGGVAAYSSGYPLQQKWADAFIAGDVTEPDLMPSMLLRRDENLNGACFYIGSVVVRPHYDSLTKAALLASLLSWRVQQLQAASVKRLSVIMTPVTDEGARLVQYGGAKKLNDGVNRKDGYPVYGRAVSPEFLLRASAAIERCLSSRFIQFGNEAEQAPDINRATAVSGRGRVLDKDATSPSAVATLDLLNTDRQVSQSALGVMCHRVLSGLRGRIAAVAKLKSANAVVGTLASLALATGGLMSAHTLFESEHWTFGYLLPLSLIAARYGRVYAAAALAICLLSSAFLFYEPTWSLYIEETEDIVELGFFSALAALLCWYMTSRPRPIAVRTRA